MSATALGVGGDGLWRIVGATEAQCLPGKADMIVFPQKLTRQDVSGASTMWGSGFRGLGLAPALSRHAPIPSTFCDLGYTSVPGSGECLPLQPEVVTWICDKYHNLPGKHSNSSSGGRTTQATPIIDESHGTNKQAVRPPGGRRGVTRALAKDEPAPTMILPWL